MQIKNQPYQTIIDSGAAVSMIAYSVVKELGLKIDTCSSSLIVLATGSSIRPLEIIKNLLIEIKGITISIDFKIIDTISYSLLLSNN